MSTIGPHIKTFNDRIKIMNQSGKKDIVINANDARNLHAEIFSLLALISELSSQLQKNDEVDPIKVEIDGGSF